MNTSSMVVARAEIEATVILLSLMSPRTAWQSRCRQMQLLDKRAQLHPQDMGQHWDTQNLKWSEVIRSDKKWSVDVNFPSTSDIDDSISKKTRCRVQLHLGSVEQGIIRGVVMSCVEHITELHRKMARSQDFAFQKVSGICHRNTQK